MRIPIPNEVKPFFEFALHVIFGGLVFVLIFLFAYGTGELARWLEINGHVSDIMPEIMKYAEAAIFIADVALFIIFSISETFRLMADRWGLKHGH